MLLAAAVFAFTQVASPWNFAILGTAIVIEIAEVYFWIWFLRRYRVKTGAEGMVGKRAVVVESDGSAGTVQVHGELWRARFGSVRAIGDEASVTAVDGLTVTTD